MLIDPAGQALLNRGEATAAEQHFHQRLFNDPANPAHLLGLALALEARQRFNEARVAIECALERAANDPTLLAFRAHLLDACGAPHQAIDAYIDLLQRHPDNLPAAHNLGTLLYRLGHFREAVGVHRDTVKRHPRAENTWRDLGQALIAWGEIDDGLAALKQALQLKPEDRDNRFAYALGLLRAERWTTAWPLYEARWHAGEAPRCLPGSLPWQGEALTGRHLAVLPEQGFGDSLLFARYLSAVADEARQITLLVPEPLRELLQASFPNIAVHSRTEDCADPVDYSCAIGSLPLHLLSRGLSTPPLIDGYLQPSANARQQIAQWLAEHKITPRTGLLWRGNPKHPQDHLRSTSLDTLFGQLTDDDKPLVSLQYAANPTEQGALAAHAILDPGPLLSNFDRAAALTASLVQVLTVDTAGANLAGALGIPFRLLSRAEGEWRWNLAEQRSPWYKSCVGIDILT